MLEGHVVKFQRDTDAPDEGGVVLADQDQGRLRGLAVMAGLDPAIHRPR
jgi:hypothetical protein